MSSVGKANWNALMSIDPEASRTFFSALFGWTFKPHSSGFMQEIWRADQLIGSCTAVSPDEGRSDWIVCFEVTDVDSHSAKAAMLGGSIAMSAMELPAYGRSAVLTDPTGAMFSIWTPAGDVRNAALSTPAVAGDVIWHDVMTSNVARALPFYGALFNWEVSETVGGSGPYFMFSSNGNAVSGAYQRPMDDLPSHWDTYFKVVEVGPMLSKIKELGGQVFTQIIEVPGRGKIAYAADPTGAQFTVMQFADDRM